MYIHLIPLKFLAITRDHMHVHVAAFSYIYHRQRKGGIEPANNFKRGASPPPLWSHACCSYKSFTYTCTYIIGGHRVLEATNNFVRGQAPRRYSSHIRLHFSISSSEHFDRNIIYTCTQVLCARYVHGRNVSVHVQRKLKVKVTSQKLVLKIYKVKYLQSPKSQTSKVPCQKI